MDGMQPVRGDRDFRRMYSVINSNRTWHSATIGLQRQTDRPWMEPASISLVMFSLLLAVWFHGQPRSLIQLSVQLSKSVLVAKSSLEAACQ